MKRKLKAGACLLCLSTAHLAAQTTPPLKPPQELSLKTTRTIDFTVDEGTWMSLDVSPAGHTLLFDLLGHLYTMPTEGGPARAITTGSLSAVISLEPSILQSSPDTTLPSNAHPVLLRFRPSRVDRDASAIKHQVNGEPLRPHVENGVPESTMLALMGHMSRAMLERYSHKRLRAKREAMTGVRLHGGEPKVSPC